MKLNENPAPEDAPGGIAAPVLPFLAPIFR
jgi:hypothetical protein